MPCRRITNKRNVMKFEFTGRHIEVTPAIRAHVKEQFQHVRHLFDGKTLHAHVIIEVERGRHRAEIVLKWHKQVMTAHAASSDMYLSLSKVVDKLEKQVLKSKSKLIDRNHKVKKITRVAPEGVSVKGPKIVAQKGYKVRSMLPEDAAAVIASGKADFVLFRNSENDKVSYLYKKKGAEYALISV